MASKSTPINRLPVESIAEDITEADDSINEVLREIESQNGNINNNNGLPLNNNVLPIINSSFPMQSQAGNMPIPQSTTPQQSFQPGFGNQPQTIDPQLIEKFLASQNSNNGFSISSFIDLFKSELKLAVAIFVVLLITNTERFNVFSQNNFNIIKVPYIVEILKAVVATVSVVLLKKIIS